MDLVLAVKREYFEAMEAGKKSFEYRLFTPYWRKRLVDRNYGRVVITLGYPKKTDESRRLYFPWRGAVVEKITHKHFGPTPVVVFAIPTSERITP